MKICKYCNTETADDAKNCPSCGANSFSYKCPNCGDVISAGTHCQRCGTRFDQAGKVCPRCKSKYYTNACPNCGFNDTIEDIRDRRVFESVYPKRKNYTFLKVLGWVLLTPVMGTIYVAKNTRLKGWMKALIIVAIWVLVVMIFAFGRTN